MVRRGRLIGILMCRRKWLVCEEVRWLAAVFEERALEVSVMII